ncbi:hypothetical protein SAMN06893096_102179 [Geodermatophilus pulveris]|uniref:Uncharacterized protein n=2 Tax=Geodermatophilus pulveris TaxID=1564159 RepID=A0A239C0L0_9ACTN|nr:hypothetical protein SAMN06893096_102179 [Geodermatophilus pulveris]
MDQLLVVLESSEQDLTRAVTGLAVALEGRATVFVPVPAVRPEARMAPTSPPVVIVALDDRGAGVDLGEWVGRYLDQTPAATLTCSAGGRSVRLDAATRSSARDAVTHLLDT